MARRETIEYLDDLDGTPLAPEELNVVEFSVGNANYVIDLSAMNKSKFDAAIGPFIAAGRRVTRNTTRRSVSRAGSATAERNRAIRKWAAKQGIEVSARGRISQDVVDAYNRAIS